jgi:hypothetical protein
VQAERRYAVARLPPPSLARNHLAVKLPFQAKKKKHRQAAAEVHHQGITASAVFIGNTNSSSSILL